MDFGELVKQILEDIRMFPKVKYTNESIFRFFGSWL